MSSPDRSLVAHRRLQRLAQQLTVSAQTKSLAHTVAEEKKTAAEEDNNYSSRQIALFDAKANESLQATLCIDTKLTINKISVHKVPNLKELFNMQTFRNEFVRTRLRSDLIFADSNTTAPELTQSQKEIGKHGPAIKVARFGYNAFIPDDEAVLLDIVRTKKMDTGKAFLRAGPRAEIVFRGSDVTAAIVTCGGLCPGLNDVIEELVKVLYYNYGCDVIYGIRNGYRGFWDPTYRPFMKLSPVTVDNINQRGGTILGASRGGFDIEKILNAVSEFGINHLYIIGGDGTHRGANKIAEEAIKRKLRLVVACIPKTIDNDIGVIDKSFGFDSAVAEAEKAIFSAVVESRCTPLGIGIVQLMGREAGYIAAHATLSARQVDLCLVPEVPFPLYGDGIMLHLDKVMRSQGSAVIVVAEGAGSHLLTASGQKDESGNTVLPEIGHFLKEEIKKYFKSKKMNVSIKYHDPSYMIRSVSANAADSIYCTVLAQNAVHAAMAGYTGFTVGVVNNRTVILPIPVISATSPSYLNPTGRTWERVLTITQQPNWSLAKKEKAATGTEEHSLKPISSK